MNFVSQTRRRPAHAGWFILMAVGVILLIGLYGVKIRTLDAKSKLTDLQRDVAREEQALQLLKAELAHLQSPERLSRLAKSELGLKPTPVARSLDIDTATTKIGKRPTQEPASEKAGGQ